MIVGVAVETMEDGGGEPLADGIIGVEEVGDMVGGEGVVNGAVEGGPLKIAF